MPYARKEDKAKQMREYRKRKKAEQTLKNTVIANRLTTKYADMTDRESCIYTRVHFQGASEEEAKKQCGKLDNKKKIRFAISADAIYEVGALELDSQPAQIKLDTQARNVRFISKGVQTEQDFIKDQLKIGDTREHAEKMAQNIMRFAEDIPVQNGEGNLATEWRLYYTHDPTGKKEFHPIEKPKPKEITPLEACAAMRRNCKDSWKAAEEIADFIMLGSAEYDETVTPLTLKLRQAFNDKKDFMTCLDLMVAWQAEREKINLAIKKREKRAEEVYGKDLRSTIGDLYGKTKPQIIQEASLKKKGPFDYSHRLTLGRLYQKPKEKKKDGETT